MAGVLISAVPHRLAKKENSSIWRGVTSPRWILRVRPPFPAPLNPVDSAAWSPPASAGQSVGCGSFWSHHSWALSWFQSAAKAINSSARRSSSADCGRFSGSFSRHDRITRSSSGGRGISVRHPGGVGGSPMCSLTICVKEERSKTWCPVTSQYATPPKRVDVAAPVHVRGAEGHLRRHVTRSPGDHPTRRDGSGRIGHEILHETARPLPARGSCRGYLKTYDG